MIDDAMGFAGNGVPFRGRHQIAVQFIGRTGAIELVRRSEQLSVKAVSGSAISGMDALGRFLRERAARRRVPLCKAVKSAAQARRALGPGSPRPTRARMRRRVAGPPRTSSVPLNSHATCLALLMARGDRDEGDLSHSGRSLSHAMPAISLSRLAIEVFRT
jgi:hypothetical protein